MMLTITPAAQKEVDYFVRHTTRYKSRMDFFRKAIKRQLQYERGYYKLSKGLDQ